MITSQDIRAKGFEKAVFGGYEMASVDQYLENVARVMDDNTREISTLKSKMKILANKVEEYRSVEDSMKEAIRNTQKSCDAKIAETKVQCAGMIRDAQAAAREADRKIAAEEARVEDARQRAARQISDLRTYARYSSRIGGCECASGQNGSKILKRKSSL